MRDDTTRGFSTRAVHGAQPSVEQEAPSVPIFQTSTFRFDSSEDYAETISFRKDGYTYTRGFGNPTVAAFESQMAALEGTEAAFGFASGMAAIHTIFAAHVRAGDRFVVSSELYGGTYSLATKVFPRMGVTVDLVDPHDLDAVRRGAAGRSAVPCRDDREPHRVGGRPAGARRALPRGRRAGVGRQHVRLAVPVHARRSGGSTS